MNQDSLELKQRITRLSDDELIQMITADAADYRKEALDYAEAELRARGIDVARTSVSRAEDKFIDDEEDKEAKGAVPLASRGTRCLVCGGRLRSGTLVAEKELSIIFGDNREERFLRVTACTQCGHVSLAVNFEEEVEG